MSRPAARCSFLAIAVLVLAICACSEDASSGPGASAAADAPTPAIRDQDVPTADASRGQAPHDAAASTPDDVAASMTASGRAMAEACGFTAAEMTRFKAQEAQQAHGPGFETKVAQHMTHARSVMAAQRRDQGTAFEDNCEYVRFMMENRD